MSGDLKTGMVTIGTVQPYVVVMAIIVVLVLFSEVCS